MSGLHTPFWWKVAIIGTWLGCASIASSYNATPFIFAVAMAVTIIAPLRDKA